jgi:hypothetical protein
MRRISRSWAGLLAAELAVLAGDGHALAGARADQVGLELGDHGEDLQALYDFLVIGCPNPRAIDRVLANLDALGIPTDHLSHNQDLAPFA